MRVAFLVENWGAPWNEGYKNLAKYIYDMLKNSFKIDIITPTMVDYKLLMKYDLVHVFNYPQSLHHIKCLLRVRRKTIKEVAKKELDINARTKIKSLIIGQTLWRNIIVTTKFLQFELEKLYGRKKPVFYLPPPIPTDYFIPLNKYKSKQSLGLDTEKVHIGYTGRLNPHRKIDILINIARNLKKDVELVFNFIGPSPRILRLLKKLSEKYQIKAVNTDDVRTFYSAVDILVYPVEREGSIEPPLTILEAMSCGCVVASYKNPVTSNLISDGYNGFLFSSADDLAEIINKLTNKELDIEAVVKNAQRFIAEKYDAFTMRRSYAKLYERLANEI